MKAKKRLILLILTAIIIYYSLNFLYFYINGSNVFIAKETIACGESITLDMVYRVRISGVNMDTIENNIIGKIAINTIEQGKILYKNDLANKGEDLNLKREKISLTINSVDKYLSKYILNRKYVNLYFIKNSEVENDIKEFRNLKVLEAYDEKGRVVNLYDDFIMIETIILEVDKEVAKELKVMQMKGTFEIGV